MSTNTTDERSRGMRDPTKDGLRFDPRDARKLAELAERARLRELGPEAVNTFSAAADAAKTGQPLVVVCTGPMEARLMAIRYARFGSRPQVLEELNGR